MAKKLPLKFQSYRVVRDALEVGLQSAIHRAFKYHSGPQSEAQIRARLDEMMNELTIPLCDVVDFGDD